MSNGFSFGAHTKENKPHSQLFSYELYASNVHFNTVQYMYISYIEIAQERACLYGQTSCVFLAIHVRHDTITVHQTHE